MSSFTGKPIKDVYKDILHTSNNNTGLSTSVKDIKCGDGDSTAIGLSQNTLKVTPNSNQVDTFRVTDRQNSNLLKVDSTNNKVFAGINAANVVNTGFYEFNLYELTPSAGTHYPMQAGGGGSSSSVAYNGNVNGTTWGGSSANPPTSLTVTSDSHGVLSAGMYLVNDIRVDSVSYLIATASASTVNIHLNRYTLQTGSGTTAGDLASGTTIALTGSGTGSLSPVTTGDDRITNGTLTKLTTECDANTMLMCFIENVGGTSVTSAKVIVKYHLK